ncbi:MAG: diguanylate cyclase [Gammaproteobacteria bacterium]
MADTLNPQEAQSIFESCPIPAVILDAQGLILGINQAFAQLSGVQNTNDLTGKQINSITSPGLKQLLTTFPKLEWEDDTGRIRNINVRRVTLNEDGTKEVRYFVDRSEIIQLENSHTVLEEKLQQNLLTDPATGLLNQRGIILALEPQIARCRRYNSTLSVVLMAVDASIDREKLLIEVSRMLKDQLRWADLVGCTENQEFMLALPETPETAAVQLTNKLVPLLEDTCNNCFPETSIWSCFGIAGWRKSDNAPSLLQRASNALTQARNSDSNKTIAL